MGPLKDVFVRKVRKIYEAIDEATMESNYEFMTDADMEALGWSEFPGSKSSGVHHLTFNYNDYQ